jgi:archaellum component FlaC
LSKWDFDRMRSLLDGASDQAASIASDLEVAGNRLLDLNIWIQRVDQVSRDVDAVKTLLKRERLKRA